VPLTLAGTRCEPDLLDAQHTTAGGTLGTVLPCHRYLSPWVSSSSRRLARREAGHDIGNGPPSTAPAPTQAANATSAQTADSLRPPTRQPTPASSMPPPPPPPPPFAVAVASQHPEGGGTRNTSAASNSGKPGTRASNRGNPAPG